MNWSRLLACDVPNPLPWIATQSPVLIGCPALLILTTAVIEGEMERVSTGDVKPESDDPPPPHPCNAISAISRATTIVTLLLPSMIMPLSLLPRVWILSFKMIIWR